MLAAVAFAVLPVRIKKLVYGNIQQGDDLVKGVQAWMLAPVLKIHDGTRGTVYELCKVFLCPAYIILHFGFDYENETQFYVLVVFYCPSARLPMLHGQGIITERKFENYTLITKIYDTLSLEVLLCKGF